MKLFITTSGNTALEINQYEWSRLGEKSGWLEKPLAIEHVDVDVDVEVEEPIESLTKYFANSSFFKLSD